MDKRIKPIVVCISGNKRHGKNTVARLMAEHLKVINGGVVIEEYAFADAVRELCAKVLFLPADTPWFHELKDTPLPRLFGLVTGRDVLKFVGTSLFRRFFPDHWADKMVKKLLKSEADYVFLTDCRFANEAKKVSKHCKYFLHVRVCCPYKKDVANRLDPTERLFEPGTGYSRTFFSQEQVERTNPSTVEHWFLYNNSTIEKLKLSTQRMSDLFVELSKEFK